MKILFSLAFLILVSGILTFAQLPDRPFIPLIGENAPSFIAETTQGTLHFPKDFGKSWKILFSHPADFTPVCTSEILELALMQKEFRELNVKFAIISTDNLELHHSWVNSMNEMISKYDPTVKINFPLIDDHNESISNLYGMISPTVDSKKTVRGVFIIDAEDKIQAILFYPKNIGRNLEEIKRTIIALQTSQKHSVLTPVNWKPGEQVLLPYPYSYDINDSIQSKKEGFERLSWYMLFKKLQ
jgi:peroxiredoxin 2/4